MKTRHFFYSVVIFAFVIGCSKEEEPQPNNSIEHTGEKWNITSVEYNMVNQDLTNPGQSALIGTTTNAGAFYFNSGKGTFDIKIGDVQKEDYFSYSESGSSVSVVSIAQNAGGTNFSQNVITLSGEKTSATTMTLDGTIMQQSMTGQFLLTATYQLTKN